MILGLADCVAGCLISPRVWENWEDRAVFARWKYILDANGGKFLSRPFP